MSNVKAVLACPSCSETTFGDTPAANAMVGRRVAQIIESYSRHTREVEYRSELLREIIGIDWLSLRAGPGAAFEHAGHGGWDFSAHVAGTIGR